MRATHHLQCGSDVKQAPRTVCGGRENVLRDSYRRRVNDKTEAMIYETLEQLFNEFFVDIQEENVVFSLGDLFGACVSVCEQYV